MNRTIKEEYLLWLSSLIGLKEHEEEGGYNFLVKALYRKEFYWVVDHDENRAEEGKNLRAIFAEKCGFDDIPDQINGPCSVLEMMIALAHKWNEYEALTEEEDYSADYFWIMIHNLGLEGCVNYQFDPDMVDKKLDILLDRDYPDNGKGSLFPLKKSHESQKNIEIWYQLQNFLMENEENW